MGDASDHILLKDIISIGKTSADGHQTEQRQAGKEIGKGTIISIKGMVRDVQATPADRVEIYLPHSNGWWVSLIKAADIP